MANLMTLVLLLATLSSSCSLKKDKFKFKAKGFGLKNLQAAVAEAAAAAPPAPAPAYYPPAPAAPYYPPAAPSGYAMSGAVSAIKSAGLNSAAVIAPQISPIVIPITLMAQHAFNEPLTSAISGINSQLAMAQMHFPRVDLGYETAPAHGYPALKSDTMDTNDKFKGFVPVSDGLNTVVTYGRK